MSSLYTLFLKTFNKKTKLVLYWIILKVNTSRSGSAIQVLPSDIGEYLSPFFNHVVVVVFTCIFISWLKNDLHCKFFYQKESFLALLTYLLTYIVLWAGKICRYTRFHPYSTNIMLRKDKFSQQRFQKISQTLLNVKTKFRKKLESFIFHFLIKLEGCQAFL